MKRSIVLSSLVYVLLVMGVANGYADEGIITEPTTMEETTAEDAISEVEPVVVTAYRTSVTETLNPSSTEVIDTDEMQEMGIGTIVEAAQTVAGLNIAGNGLAGPENFFIRGANSNHTQVLFNGIRVYDPAGPTSSYHALSHHRLVGLESVEIAKGPFSAMYGSSGIGGTVNFLQTRGEGTPTIDYTQTIGSDQTFIEELESQGEVGALAYSLGFSREDISNTHSREYKTGNFEEDPYSNMNARCRFDYTVTEELELGLFVDYINAEFEYDAWAGNALGIENANESKGRFHQGVGGFVARHKIGDLFSHEATVAITDVYRTNWESYTHDWWYKGKTYQAKWQGDLKLGEIDTVQIGVDYLRERGQFLDYDSFKETSSTKGVFIQNILTPVDNLFFAANFRFDEHSKFGGHGTYGVSGAYTFEPTGTKVKASWATGYKAPGVYELYSPYYGDPNLDAENSRTFETGIEQTVFEKIKFGSTYYKTTINDMINTVAVGLYEYKYHNNDKAKIWGLENFITYDINELTSLGIVYTYLDTEHCGRNEELARRPSDKFTIHLKTGYKKLKFFSDFSFIGSTLDHNYGNATKLRGYYLWNASANYEINKHFKPFVRIENILDQDYQKADNYETRGVSWFAGATVSF
jgi:vitamin B12 transporter